MKAIEVKDLCRSFGSLKALDGLSFAVDEGEIFGLVGPDGSGKTTCLRILCGLMEPTGGMATVLGKDVASDPEAIKTHVGYMAQPARLYEDLTVRENIEFYADIYEVPKDRYKARMTRLMEFSGLAPFKDRLFRNLSGGMKQKVGLCCTLIHTPRVLFLDEPTNGVDPVSRRDFWKILYELRRENVTIVVASTYLDEADRCHRVAFFEKGKVRMVEEPLELRKLLRHRLFNLIVADRRRAMALLGQIQEVSDFYVFGAGIHLILQGEADPASITKALAREGLQVPSMEPVHPSLEDVYLSILKKGEAK
jgi:ABC-2 type transport system ATP-binding protein